MSEKNWVGKGILMRCIIEILGAPQEHITQSLKDFVKKLKEDEHLTVVKSDYAEPKEQGKLFSAFVEIELWIKDMPEVLGFCISAMPSSIEILEPDELKMEAIGFTDVLNDLQTKLHAIDMKLKTLSSKNTVLEKNTYTLAANLVGIALKGGKQTAQELQNLSGIPIETLQNLLTQMEGEGRIIQEDSTYSLK